MRETCFYFHIDFFSMLTYRRHALRGLAIVFAEGVPEVPKQDFTTSA
jgi:hypothetical protein